MARKLGLQHSGEILAALISLALALMVLYNFVIGHHYLIPTALLVPCIFFGNLAWYGFVGQKWARHVLAWLLFVITSCCFFGVFWAQKPKALLGAAFLPVAILVTALFAWLTWSYVRRNHLLAPQPRQGKRDT